MIINFISPAYPSFSLTQCHGNTKYKHIENNQKHIYSLANIIAAGWL